MITFVKSLAYGGISKSAGRTDSAGLRKINDGFSIPSLQETFLFWSLVTDTSVDIPCL